MSRNTREPLLIQTLETCCRGDALQAAAEWSMEQGACLPNLLPRKNSRPSRLERAWNDRVALYATIVGTDQIVAEQALRQKYVDFLSRLKLVLDELDSDCRRLPVVAMMPLAYLGCEECGWTKEQIIEMVNEYHQDSCRRCSTR